MVTRELRKADGAHPTASGVFTADILPEETAAERRAVSVPLE